MLLPQKFQKLYLTPKLLKIKFSCLLVFLFYNCSSLPFISDRCDFPEQVLEPGGILNLKKNPPLVKPGENLIYLLFKESGYLVHFSQTLLLSANHFLAASS